MYRDRNLGRHVGWWRDINYMNESKHRILIFCQPYGFSQSKVRGIAHVNRHQNALIHSRLPVELDCFCGTNNSSYKCNHPSPSSKGRAHAHSSL